MNTRFWFYSASQTYNGLNDVQQKFVQNFKNTLTLRGMLPPDEFLTDVVRESALEDGAFGHIYEGRWKERQVVVKTFGPVTPPVFLIPSDSIRLPDE